MKIIRYRKSNHSGYVKEQFVGDRWILLRTCTAKEMQDYYQPSLYGAKRDLNTGI